jgi:hypothetical protein
MQRQTDNRVGTLRVAADTEPLKNHLIREQILRLFLDNGYGT